MRSGQAVRPARGQCVQRDLDATYRKRPVGQLDGEGVQRHQVAYHGVATQGFGKAGAVQDEPDLADATPGLRIVPVQVDGLALGTVSLDGKPAEGERQVDEAQPDLQRVADRGAAGQRETPDPVGRQVIAGSGRHRQVGVGAGRQRRGDRCQLLLHGDLGAGSKQRTLRQTGVAQDDLRAHAALVRQPHQQQGAGRAAPAAGEGHRPSLPIGLARPTQPWPKVST